MLATGAELAVGMLRHNGYKTLYFAEVTMVGATGIELER
jgi:hypothetical protein